MACLQHPDEEVSFPAEAEVTDIIDLERELSLLEVANSMPAPAEVYGQRAQQDPQEVGYPNISYNAPPLKRFSGKSGEYQTITDFIESIERQAKLECRNDAPARVKLSLSLFRTNLKGDARSYLNMLTSTEKDNWEKLKEVYTFKFKTERDLRARQHTKEQCASFKQRPDESLKAYGERAMKLRQLIDASEEGFLVYRFLRGIRDKSVRQILAANPEDMGKITVAQMNARIGSLVRVGEESGASNAETNNSSDDSSEDSDTDSSQRRHKGKKAKEKESKELKKAMKTIAKLEERMAKMELGGNTDTFAAQAVYNNGANYRRAAGNGEGTQGSAAGGQRTDGFQRGDLPDNYLCYNCGNPGHLYRFCLEPKSNQGEGVNRANNQQNARQGWNNRRPIIFPRENGPQTMVWVDSPSNGLVPGYYPVDTGSALKNETSAGGTANKGSRTVQTNVSTSSQITERNNTASVDLVSSAARNMTIGSDVVRYVNAVEEAYAGERRRRAQNDAGSSEATMRTRIRLGEPMGSQSGQASTSAARPATPIPAARKSTPVPAPNAQRPSPRILQDSDEEPEQEELPPVRKRWVAVARPPRHIRMIIERPSFDVVAEFRDLPVANVKWGMLMDIAPALSRQAGTGLLLERQAKRTKGKGKATAGPTEMGALRVNRASGAKYKEPSNNFYTPATLTVNRKQFKIEKVMIDAGSVVNLASIEVLETLGVGLYPVRNLTIPTATSALTKIQYYSDLEIEVAEVNTAI